MLTINSVTPILALALGAIAAAAPPATRRTGEEAITMPPAKREPVAGLPFARGASFATLDEYLAHLRKSGAIGVPWYRQVGPDIYELVARRGPGQPSRQFTRAELARRFGFVEEQ